MPIKSEPVIHELRVDAKSIYQVYEVDHGNLEATCRALLQQKDDGGHTVPLLVSHSPRPSPRPAGLPAQVPWLVVHRTMADTLQSLHENLVMPILQPGLVSVDFSDYANALSRGGEIHMWSTRGQDGPECVAGLLKEVGCRRLIAAACLHIRAPGRLGLDPFDKVFTFIERGFPALASNECLVVVAATSEQRWDVSCSLLIVSGSE